MTYDEQGNIISDDFAEPKRGNSKNAQNTDSVNDESQGHIMNVISPELEQARQLTAKVLTDKGYPIAGAAFSAVAYGLEIFMGNNSTIQDSFNLKGRKV